MKAIDFEEAAADRYKHHTLTGGPAQGSMTMLDYFAAKAMEAYIISWVHGRPPYSEFAEAAYDMAEAMLKERNKRFTPPNVVTGVTGRSYG